MKLNLGPYGLSGTLALKPQGYAVRGLRVRVANTSLNGDLSPNIARESSPAPLTRDGTMRTARRRLRGETYQHAESGT